MKGQEEETRNTASLLQFRLVCTKDESHNFTENHDCGSASSLYTHTHTCMLSIRQALCTTMPCCIDIVPGRIHWPTCVEKVSSLPGWWQPPFISSTDSVSFRTLSPHMISHWCSYFVSQNKNLRTVITASRLSSCRRSTVPSSVSIQEDLRTKGVLLTLHFLFLHYTTIYMTNKHDATATTTKTPTRNCFQGCVGDKPWLCGVFTN